MLNLDKWFLGISALFKNKRELGLQSGPKMMRCLFFDDNLLYNAGGTQYSPHRRTVTIIAKAVGPLVSQWAIISKMKSSLEDLW